MGLERTARRAPAPTVPSRSPTRRSRAPDGLGNQARLRRLGAQGKLKVHPAGDAHEQEADRVAEEVTARAPAGKREQGGPAAVPAPEEPVQTKAVAVTPVQRSADGSEEEPVQREAVEDEEPVQKQAAPEEEEPVQKKDAPEEEEPVQRMEAPEEEEPVQKKDVPEEEEPVQRETAPEDEEPVQAKADAQPEDDEVQRSADGAREAGDEVQSELEATQGGGSPLDPQTRALLEPRFGRDLGDVRIHADSTAARLSKKLGAHAFTRGTDVYFASGRYAPESVEGRRLLAHELTHVLQQNPGLPRVGARPGAESKAAGVVAPEAAGGETAGQEAGAAGTGNGAPGAAAAGAAAGAEVAPGAAGGPGAGGGVAVSSVGVGVQRSNPRRDASGRFAEDSGELSGDTVRFRTLKVPDYKLSMHPQHYAENILRSANYKRGNSKQEANWRKVNTTESKKKLEKAAKDAFGVTSIDQIEGPIGFQAPRNDADVTFGRPEQVAEQLRKPRWNRRGTPKIFQIDHIKELQIGGFDDEHNLELLDERINASSGGIIVGQIGSKVKKFIKTPEGEGKSEKDVKKNYNLLFERGVRRGKAAGGENSRWKKDAIEAGEHLENIRVLNRQPGGNGTVMVFPSASGGSGAPFRYRRGGEATTGSRDWLKPFTIVGAHFDVGPESQGSRLGHITVSPGRTEGPGLQVKEPGARSLLVQRMGNFPYAGYIEYNQIIRELQSAYKAKPLSPLDFTSVQVTPTGLSAVGTLTPSFSFLKNPINFGLRDGGLFLSTTFDAEGLEVPDPFEVRSAAVTVELGTEGFRALGQVEAAVQGLGEGTLTVEGGNRQPFRIIGDIMLEGLGDEARLRVTYTKGQGDQPDAWDANAHFVLPQGTPRGVKRAEVDVTYASAEKVLNAEVKTDLDTRALRQGTLRAAIRGDGQHSLEGDFELGEIGPFVRGGSLHGKMTRGEDGMKVAADGTINANFAGQDFVLSGSYEDGLFDLNVRTAFERGMLSGTLEAGVTNRPVTEGRAEGAPVSNGPVRPYGGGTATVRIAPWLEGTAGIRLNERGEVELSGEVGLPDALEVFPRKELEKELLSVGFDIPIVGVAVAGQRIGVFLNISGSLKANAGIGPGKLEELGLSVFYNPSQEDQTRVTGGATLRVPADAGLRLGISASLGAGIPVVSARAGLEVGGTLGIEGAATATVQVEWTPGRGLVLDAKASLEAQPTFKFDITGFVKVEADLLFTTLDLYEKRWQLAAFEYGSGMTFGVDFPVHYEEGQPFDVSLDDVEFRKPDVDPQALLSGLIRSIA